MKWRSRPISQDLACVAIRHLLESGQNNTSRTIYEMMTLLLFCLNTVFTFGGKIYQHVTGTPMGSPPSGIISEAVLHSGPELKHRERRYLYNIFRYSTAFCRTKRQAEVSNPDYTEHLTNSPIQPTFRTLYQRYIGRHRKNLRQAWSTSGSQTMWNVSTAVDATRKPVPKCCQIKCRVPGGLQMTQRILHWGNQENPIQSRAREHIGAVRTRQTTCRIRVHVAETRHRLSTMATSKENAKRKRP